MSAWTGATDALVDFLAQQQLAKRQAMLDELTQSDRARSIAREDRRDARAAREEAAKIAEREGAAAKAKAESDRASTVRNLTGQRQASLNLAGSDDPTGAQATRDTLAVALRVAGAGDVADAGAKADVTARQAQEKQDALAAYDADPSAANARTLKVRFGVDVPRPERDPLEDYEARKRIDAKYERPASGPAPQIFTDDEGNTRAIVFERGQAREVPLPPGLRKAGSDKPTEGQTNAAGFADRMEQLAPVINELEGYAASSLGSRWDAIAPNELRSGAGQKYEAAKQNFLAAQLRKESGAAISTGEYEQGDLQYFPQPGDSKTVIDQKRKLRETAIAAMRRSAGRAGTREAAGAPAPSRKRYNPATGKLE